MRLLHSSLLGGSAPKPRGFFRFFPARMRVLFLLKGTGWTCPRPFRPLIRSLELLPSSALSLPAQVGLVSIASFVCSTKSQRTAITPLTSCLTFGVHRRQQPFAPPQHTETPSASSARQTESWGTLVFQALVRQLWLAEETWLQHLKKN